MTRAVLLPLLLLIAEACGAYERPTRDAIIASVGAGATGAAISLQVCQREGWQTCRETVVSGLVIAGCIALVSGANAFTKALEPPSPAAPTPRS